MKIQLENVITACNFFILNCNFQVVDRDKSSSFQSEVQNLDRRPQSTVQVLCVCVCVYL